MCTDCFDEDDEPPAIPPSEVAWLARRIEAEMSGEALTPRLWAVYLGQESGALDWRSLERIGRAMEAARLAASLVATPRPGSSAGP